MEKKKLPKKKQSYRKTTSIALYIIGIICLILGVIDIIPDILQSGWKDIGVLILFMFIVNIRAFALLMIGIVLLLIGSLIKR